MAQAIKSFASALAVLLAGACILASCSKVDPESEVLPTGKTLSKEKITDSRWESLGIVGNVWKLTGLYEFKKGEWSKVETPSISIFYFRDPSNVSYWQGLQGGNGRWSYDLSESVLSIGSTAYKMFPHGNKALYLMKDKELGELTRLSDADAAAYKKAR